MRVEFFSYWSKVGRCQGDGGMELVFLKDGMNASGYSATPWTEMCVKGSTTSTSNSTHQSEATFPLDVMARPSDAMFVF